MYKQPPPISNSCRKITLPVSNELFIVGMEGYYLYRLLGVRGVDFHLSLNAVPPFESYIIPDISGGNASEHQTFTSTQI